MLSLEMDGYSIVSSPCVIRKPEYNLSVKQEKQKTKMNKRFEFPVGLIKEWD